MGQSEVASAIYDLAALEPDRWPVALAALAESTGSDFAQIIGFGNDLDIDFNWLAGVRDGVAMSKSIIALPQSLNYRVVAKLQFPDEAILYERHYEMIRSSLPSQQYSEVCQTYGIENGCQTDLYHGVDGFVGMALLRSAESGKTSRAQRAEFDLHRRAAGRAIALQIALEREGYRIIAGALESMKIAAFVLDSRMRVGSFTPKAEKFLSNGSFRIDQGVLECFAASGTNSFRNLSAQMANGSSRGGKFVTRTATGDTITVQLNRLPSREYDLGFAPYAVLVAKAVETETDDAIALLKLNFGLTEAEAQIALLMSQGLNRNSIQATRNIGRETLRSHVRSIFGKLGVHREADAVRLIIQLIE